MGPTSISKPLGKWVEFGFLHFSSPGDSLDGISASRSHTDTTVTCWSPKSEKFHRVWRQWIWETWVRVHQEQRFTIPVELGWDNGRHRVICSQHLVAWEAVFRSEAKPRYFPSLQFSWWLMDDNCVQWLWPQARIGLGRVRDLGGLDTMLMDLFNPQILGLPPEHKIDVRILRCSRGGYCSNTRFYLYKDSFVFISAPVKWI